MTNGTDQNTQPVRPLGTRPEVARHLRMSTRTLERMAASGTGPDFSIVGGRALYSWEDVAAWLRRQPGQRRSAA